MTDLETKMITQLDELTKRVNNLEITLFTTVTAQAELMQPQADKINKKLMKMFYKVGQSYGLFKEDKASKKIGLIFKNGDKL